MECGTDAIVCCSVTLLRVWWVWRTGIGVPCVQGPSKVEINLDGASGGVGSVKALVFPSLPPLGVSS